MGGGVVESIAIIISLTGEGKVHNANDPFEQQIAGIVGYSQHMWATARVCNCLKGIRHEDAGSLHRSLQGNVLLHVVAVRGRACTTVMYRQGHIREC